jgi:hypothetical protein
MFPGEFVVMYDISLISSCVNSEAEPRMQLDEKGMMYDAFFAADSRWAIRSASAPFWTLENEPS